jgi:DNA-binding transcriptional ArsR family regulator
MNSGTAEVSPGAGVASDQAGKRETVLVRVNFTPDDVARTRFGLAPVPLTETALAMVALRRAAVAPGRGRTSPWIREARLAFPTTARPLFDLLGPVGPWPDFFDSVSPDIEEGLEELRATPRAIMRAQLSHSWGDRRDRPPTWVRSLADGDKESVDLVLRALRDLHKAVVAPRWDNARIAFHADVARRMPVLAGGGHEALFDTLHPRLRWRDDGLDRPGIDCVCNLQGEGMTLMPSAFWTGEPLFSGCGTQRRPSVLLYAAAPPSGLLAGKDCLADQDGHDSLAALLGPTRAAVLRALSEPRGTADLAAAVHVSPASASEHAKVLRDAYLIETRREGRTVRHSLTALGRTMLGQLPGAEEWSAGAAG